MKPKLMFVGALAIVAGASLAVGAENQEKTKQMETRIVVGGPAQRMAPASREPVPYLGVAVAPAGPALTSQLRLPEGQGLVVTVVEPDSPAGKAGLQQHDVITKLDDQILIEPRQLSVLVRGHGEGDKVTVTYLRAGTEARVTATLSMHVPPSMPRQTFQWMGEGGPDVLFHTEEFNLPHPPPGAKAGEGGLRRFPFPNTPMAPGMPGPGAPVMIFRPRAEVVISDDAGELFVHINENGRVLTAKDADGAIVFDGPIDTPEQRAALPEALRTRLEKLESRDVLDLTVPPPDEASLPSLGSDRPVRAAVL